MPLMHQKSGELTFNDGFYFRANMSAVELTGSLFPPSTEVLALGSHPIRGSHLAVFGTLNQDRLSSITLYVDSAGSKSLISSARQRAFIFSSLQFTDPCPDTHRNVRINCPFGDILISSDPITGQASARINYTKVNNKGSERN